MVNFIFLGGRGIRSGDKAKRKGAFYKPCEKNAYWSEFVQVLPAAFSRARDALLA